MSAVDLDTVAVGDPVQVSGGGRQSWVGTVVKVGRTLVHVEAHGRTETYYRDGHRRRDGYSGGFRTVARVIDDERRANATERLRGHGVAVERFGGPGWSTTQLVELAEAVERIAAVAP